MKKFIKGMPGVLLAFTCLGHLSLIIGLPSLPEFNFNNLYGFIFFLSISSSIFLSRLVLKKA